MKNLDALLGKLNCQEFKSPYYVELWFEQHGMEGLRFTLSPNVHDDKDVEFTAHCNVDGRFIEICLDADVFFGTYHIIEATYFDHYEAIKKDMHGLVLTNHKDCDIIVE